MRNLKRNIIVILSFLIGIAFSYHLSAQCPGGEFCEDAYVFCSLDELNGFYCYNSFTGSHQCTPVCSGTDTKGMGPFSWWAFQSLGGPTSITLTYGLCADTDGDGDKDALVWGIYGSCPCGGEVFCTTYGHPVANGQTFTGQLLPCKVYYLVVSGREGDICGFTISTSGGGPPALDSIGYINDEPSGVIEPICAGVCSVRFFVDPIPSHCPVNYIWTLDGVLADGNKNEIYIGFPYEGDFEICASASTGAPGTRCAEAIVGPKCATIHVKPKPEPVDIYYISCDNKPYVDYTGKKWFPCLNQWEVTLPPKTKPLPCCDSIIRLTAINVELVSKWQAKCASGKVDLSPNLTMKNTCNAGETYQYAYKWYKKSDATKKSIGTDDHLLVSAVNSDYCLEVDITVDLETEHVVCQKIFCDPINEIDYKSDSTNIVLNYCDSTTINGQTYTQSTILSQQFKNTYGCDSVSSTLLNISKSDSSDLVLNTCDSAVVNGQTYFQSGSFQQFFQNSTSCDSTLNINLDIHKSNSTNLTYNSCDSLKINGQLYTQSGNYILNLKNVNLCDSTVNLDITIPKSSIEQFSFSACDSVNFNGQTYKKSGDYTQSFKRNNLCDSIIIVHVNITNSNLTPSTFSKCDSAIINGTKYTQSGIYTQLLKSANGCDSTLKINLTISKSSSTDINWKACDSAVINGQKYLQSGIYKQVFQNSKHCDSIVNIDLNLSKGNSSSLPMSSCDSIFVNGQTYKQSGDFIQMLTNKNQCDSILTIHFTKLGSSSADLNYTSCDSVVVNGVNYKQSGHYTQSFMNSNQCDSILNLNVTISKSINSNLKKSSCDSITINGTTYKQSGNYIQTLTNASKCDSVLNINLEIFKSSSSNLNVKSCDSVLVNGLVYKQSGNFTQFLKTSNQCDSTLSIGIAIQKSTSGNYSQKVCDSILINGKYYNVSGSYLQKLINSNGCDSTLTLDLIITPSNTATLDAGKDTSICEGEIVKLNGVFQGKEITFWQSANGSFDNPNNLATNYYPDKIGDEKLYLNAVLDCGQLMDSLTIHVLPRQVVRVTGDTILEPCKEMKFTATGGTNYIWTPASLIECLDPACKTIQLKSIGNFKFTITTDGPCVVPANLNVSESRVQTELYVPNVFSPNGDNINDVFLPVVNCDLVEFYSLQIFDRWGNLLFESQNKDKGWNGKFQDQNMNPGVYPYVIQYKIPDSEKKVKKGDLTLIR